MLTLFRINDPLRLLLLLFLWLVVRLPIILQNPLTLPELHWLLVGEKMDSGAMMYSGIWDNLPPFSAAIYWFFDYIFGKTIFAQQILAMFMVFFQALFFNQLLFKKSLYPENTNLPAFLYILLMSMSFDLTCLSPALLAMNFLLVIIKHIFSLHDNAIDEHIFQIGIYIGISSMLYVPSLLFLGFVILGFGIFRTVNFRQYLLLFYGVFLVFVTVGLYYYWLGALLPFLENFVFNIIEFVQKSPLDSSTILCISMFPVLFLFIAIVKVIGEGRYINFQSNCQLLMLVWLGISILTLFISYQFSGFELVIFIPAAVFFINYFFLMIKRKWLAEVLMSLFCFGILFVSLGGFYKTNPITQYVSYKDLLINQQEKRFIEDQSILILGESTHYYYHQQLATPYLNWRLAKKHLSNLDYYNILIEVYNNFKKDQPDMIIDQTGFSQVLFQKIPLLKDDYIQKDSSQIFYLRKNR